MPRIPLYNQGQGPRVGLATGALSPRASTEAFTAPGRALAGFGEAAGQVAFQFGMAEKKAETERVLNEELAKRTAEADELILNPKSKTVDGFNIESGEYKKSISADIDGRVDLTRSQKAQVKQKLLESVDRKISVGRSLVFTKQQSERSDAMNGSIESYIDEAVKTPSMFPEILADIENLVSSSEEQGLSLSYGDFKGVKFEIEKRKLLAEQNDETLNVQHFENKLSRVLNGEGEFAGFDAGERDTIASSVSSQLDYMKTGLVSEVGSRVQQQSVLMSTADSIETREGHKQLAMAEINRLQKAGLESQAEVLMQDVTAFDAGLDFGDNFAFADAKSLKDALGDARQEFVSEKDPEKILVAQKKYEAINKSYQNMLEQRQNDPAQYVYDKYKVLYNKAPSVAENVSKQREMGFSDADIKPLTSQQASNVMGALNQSMLDGDPQGLKDVVNSIPGIVGNESLVIRQMSEEGMGLAMMYAASIPDSSISKTLMKASVPGGITLNVSKQKRDMIESVVMNNQSVKDHLESMGGKLYQDFLGNALNSTGIDSPAMDAARKKHVSMIADLTVYLAQEDGKFFGDGGITEPSEVESYATKAASILSQKYDYVKVNGSTLRLKNHQSKNFGKEITDGINISLNMLDESSIYYESSSYKVGTPEYNAEKSLYIERLLENYGTITINGDSAAAITDEVGGSVLIQTIDEDGNTQVEPLTVAFADAVDVNSKFGEPKKKELIEQRQKLGRELRSLSGKKNKQEERARLKEEIDLLKQQINQL